MPDIAGNNTTMSSISVGSSVSSSIETPNDHDWFRIDLVAGQIITIRLSGTGASPLSDPYLRLRSASGDLLVENDDSGGSLNSAINYTVTATGTYYIDAAAWASPAGETTTGTYTLEVRPYVPPPVATVDQFAYQLTNGYWGGSSHHFNVTPGGNLSVNLTALTSDGQNMARLALAQWSDVIGVSFREVANGGQITFDDNEDGAFSSAAFSNGISTSARVNVSIKWLTDYGTTIGSYGFQTYLHEIGHALGLGHAGNYNTTADYPNDAAFSNDAWPMSVMSYFSVTENSYFSSMGFSQNYLGTPMLADIMAMSVLYGLSTATRAGSTTYGFNSNAGDVYNANLYPTLSYTVFDSGGIDTLDYSGFLQDQRIDLNSGSFSDIGGRNGNVTIALGTQIENAVAGDGNDQLRGNSAGNNLTGGTGADTLYGGAGDDILSGDRFASFDNGTTVDKLYGGAGNDFLFSGYGDIVDGGEGFDTVGLSYVGASAGIIGDTSILHQGLELALGGGTFRSVERFADIALTAFADKMVIGDQADPATIRSWDGDDWLIGQNVSVTMFGGNGNDLLVGSRSDDVLYGENGDDQLMGYLGTDELWGGAGADRFFITHINTRARIMDFEHGVDKIDVSGIDANLMTSGDQAFTFLGTANFSGAAGELRLTGSLNGGYELQGDIEGDGLPDFIISLGSVSNVTGVDLLL